MLEYFRAEAKTDPTELNVLFDMNAFPGDAKVQQFICNQTNLPVHIFHHPTSHASPFAMWVDFVIHRLTALVDAEDDERRPSMPPFVRRKLFTYIDMLWPLVASVANSIGWSEEKVQAHFNAEWWFANLPNPNTVMCEENLDRRPVAHMFNKIASMLCAYEGPTTAQQEHDPLTTLLRKAWPQKHQLTQFQKKFIRVINMSENRRIREDAVMADGVPYIPVVEIPGVFGGRRKKKYKNKSQDSAAAILAAAAEAQAATAAIFDDSGKRELPPVTLKEITERILAVPFGIQVTRYVLQWWCLFQAGAYSHSNTQLTDWRGRSETCLLWRSINTFTTADLVEQSEIMSSRADVLLLCVNEFMLHAVLSTPALRYFLLETPKWYGFEQLCIQMCDQWRQCMSSKDTTDMETFQSNSHVFLKGVNEVGITTRVPLSWWSFVYHEMGSETPELMVDGERIKFQPTRVQLAGVPSKVTSKAFVECERVYAHLRSMLDNQHVIGRFDRPFELLGETEGHARILSRHSKLSFLVTRRILQTIMIHYHCNPEATEAVLKLVELFYQYTKCGKPTVAATFHDLRISYPYEYAILFASLTAWCQWNLVWRVPLPENVVKTQLDKWEWLFPRGLPPRIDWLLYCPNCLQVRSLIDQSRAAGDAYPKHFNSMQAMGFEGPLVDIKERFRKPGAPESDQLQRTLYCPRQQGELAKQCEQTRMLHVCMTGHRVVFNNKPYQICSTLRCYNRVELNPCEDEWTLEGVVCKTCIFRRRTATAQELRAKLEDSHKEMARKLQKEAAAADQKQAPVRNTVMFPYVSQFLARNAARFQDAAPCKTAPASSVSSEPSTDGAVDEDDDCALADQVLGFRTSSKLSNLNEFNRILRDTRPFI